MIVAVYARVSTAQQAEKDLSIPDQLRQLRAWCSRQGHAVAVEYVEPGASATDDRRPVFQQMIGEAGQVPRPFEAILVHSQSRFFRDLVQYALYERKLQGWGIRLLSITQPTGDELTGELLRRMISLFDEYQSKETGKHTLRAMQENARQGYCNGSAPPFGYRTQAVPRPGRQGAKKRLVIHDGEAAIVRQLFALYLQGNHGQDLGDYGIARLLDQRGITYRGKPWGKGRVQAALTNRTYLGERVFNLRNTKTGRRNPASDWIVCPVPPIIPAATFQAVQAKRASRRPTVVAPRVVSSPSLLTGLVTCGACGAGMTLATGKGGRYRYYKCSNRIRRGTACPTGAIRVEHLDAAVRHRLCERVLTPQRLTHLLATAQARLRRTQATAAEELRHLRAMLDQNRHGSTRLYAAVEQGLLPVDPGLTARARELSVQRQTLLAQIAGLERDQAFATTRIAPTRVAAFCRAMRATLLDDSAPVGKRYLHWLVDEIRITGKSAVLRGNYAALAHAVRNLGHDAAGVVPTFGPEWLPGKDSNRARKSSMCSGG
jgi:DNA invertase Pin-like site-specific DNA recombinase